MRKLVTASLIFALSVSPLVSMAETIITWQSPENYKDIRATQQNQKSYQKQVFKKLEKYMQRLTKKLPAGQHLTLTMTDLDLAGIVVIGGALPGRLNGFSSSDGLRVVKSIDFPQMSFSFELKDSSGRVLLEGEESLKDLDFKDKIRAVNNGDALRYEKRMLKNWFKTILQLRVVRSIPTIRHYNDNQA